MPGRIRCRIIVLLCVLFFTLPANAVENHREGVFEQPLAQKPSQNLDAEAPSDLKPLIPQHLGNDDSNQYISNPISIFDGNKKATRTDVRINTPHANGLTFIRHYSSRLDHNNDLGFGWSHQYGETITYTEFNGTNYLRITKANGWSVYFVEGTDGRWDGAFKERTYLMAEDDGYTWYYYDGTKYHFVLSAPLVLDTSGPLAWIEDVHGNRQTMTRDGNDRLQTVTDAASGRTLTFHYGNNNRIDHITGPVTPAIADGIWVRYGYDTNDNLISVTYPDGSGFKYGYTDPNDPHNLTEKKDTLDHVLATWTYDVFDRVKASTTRYGNGVTIDYLGEGLVKATNAYGKTRTYHIDKISGIKRITAIEDGGSCAGCDGQAVRYKYDSELRVTEKEYANGAIDQFSNFDANGNARRVVHNVGTSLSKIIRYTFHPVTGQVLSQNEGSVVVSGRKEVIYDYDNDGNSTPNENPTDVMSRMIERGYTRNIKGSRVAYEYITNYQYNTKGQLESIDGPLPGSQDMISITYDPESGNLLTITLPLVGTATLANYDGAGNPGTMTDINNVVTQFSYDGRNRLISSQTGGVTTSRSYTTAGDLEVVTNGAGRTVAYSYDGQYGRLERISDSLGNSLRYQYNGQGDQIEVGVYDTGGSRQQYTRYDYQHPQWPGKLYQTIYPGGVDVTYNYDAMGNRTEMIDELGRLTRYTFDQRNRLTEVEDPGPVTTGYRYDKQNHLINVTDGKGNETVYTVDDMGRITQVASPDTNTTRYEYDEAGNLVAKTDAKNITTTYQYDTLNRLTHIIYPDPAENVTLVYDEGTYGMGRLTSVTDSSGSTAYTYNQLGQVIQEVRVIHGVSYATSCTYDGAGQIETMTYPSGRVIVYQKDSAGRITGTTVDGQSITGDVRYLPFGPVTGMTFGSGMVNIDRQFDERYLLRQNTAGSVMDHVYTRDPKGNVESISGKLEATVTAGETTYDYDGNRLTEAAGQQPASYTHDNNGNITSDGTRTFIYNQNNRLIRVAQEATVVGEYGYDFLERRVKKTVSGTTTHYHYDFMGNLIAETGADGTPLRDIFYQNGERIAMRVYGAQAGTYYFLNDHLGTPQTVIDSSAQVVWQAAYLPFGKAQIVTETVENNFRFPGQYYDSETGLHYNYHRYYDPSTGRYLTPDPIGIEGGSNLYTYVLNDPINWIDPAGKQASEVIRFLIGGLGGAFGGTIGGGVVIGLAGIWAMHNLIPPVPEHPGVPGFKGQGSPPYLEAVDDKGNECEDPPDYPTDPSSPPGPDWEWRGGEKGSWHRKNPKQSYRPHPEGPKNPHGEHYDWKTRHGKWRHYPDGRLEPR